MRITFIPSSDETDLVVPMPRPASAYLPEWYRKAEPGVGRGLFDHNGVMKRSFKTCMPFGDAMRAGYIQETWCDIHISQEQNRLAYNFSTTPSIMGHRDPDPDHVVPVSEALWSPADLAWHTPWTPKTPRGWSILFCSPLNRFDLPFQVTAGIIDSDRFFHTPGGQVPFVIRRGFSGLIPKGTPMYQMIPIRRQERWRASRQGSDEQAFRKRHHEIVSQFTGAYRDKFWIPKRYE